MQIKLAVLGLLGVITMASAADAQNFRALGTRRGAVAGAIIGGVIGGQNDEVAAGIIAGGLVGGVAGRAIGNRVQQNQIYYGTQRQIYSPSTFHSQPVYRTYAQPQYQQNLYHSPSYGVPNYHYRNW